MPWKRKHATLARNDRWIRIVQMLPGCPSLLIVDAACFGTLRAMQASPALRRRRLDITIVNFDKLPSPPKSPSTWTVRVLRGNFYDLGLFAGAWNGIYADLCGVGVGVVDALRGYLDESHPYAFMATICSGRGRRGWTLEKRVSAANASARARLSLRRETKRKRSASMCTLEGHNAAFRRLYQGRVRVHTWENAVDVISKPIRPKGRLPWMIRVRDESGVRWNLELTDVYR